MIKCPCGLNDIEETAKICSYCGILLKLGSLGADATRSLTGALDEDGVSRWGTSYFNQRMALMLRIRGTEQTFLLPSETLDDALLGRFDPHTGERPLVDLTPYGASDKGVSRKHALISRRDVHTLHLTDLDSANSTYLNGQRLIPQQPRILRNGDEIRLGRLVLNVEFTRGTAIVGTNPLPTTGNMPPNTPNATQEVSKLNGENAESKTAPQDNKQEE
jgi:hypothetical protein